ncbi:hypothetical protein GWI34_05850 [Actinomadura sp. DSM 109109]|nr:hypothetical protein [Actinomadura lepetitiana]
MDGSERARRAPEGVTEIGSLFGRPPQHVVRRCHGGDGVTTLVMPEPSGVQFPRQERVDLLSRLRQAE